jgi:transcriptional regulator with XRE-family HTH domain
MAKKAQKYSGRLVAQIRKIIGKSQSQFAVMVGVSKHAIISVENGRNKLTQKLAKRIRVATGADITGENFRFEPVGNIPAVENPHKLTPEALNFLHRRYDGTGKYDDLYTREDFDQWRANFYPSNDEVARKHFDQIKTWVEYLFRAAAKSSIAGNRDRLPAVRQSLVEWLDGARENFKLEQEVDAILEEETHCLGEFACNILSLTNPENQKEHERVKDEIASYGYDFAYLKKQCKKAKRGDWIVLETESRRVWDPFDGHAAIPCASRKLLKKPKFRFEDGWDVVARMMNTSKENLLQRQADLLAKCQAKHVDSK